MSDINPSKTITVSYDMYTEYEGMKELVEQATEEHPFQFTTGLGFTFEAFEEKFKTLKEGDTFNFTLTKDETNGDRRDDLVFDVQPAICAKIVPAIRVTNKPCAIPENAVMNQRLGNALK